MLHSATQGRVPEIIALILSHPLDIDPRTVKGLHAANGWGFFPKGNYVAANLLHMRGATYNHLEFFFLIKSNMIAL